MRKQQPQSEKKKTAIKLEILGATLFEDGTEVTGHYRLLSGDYPLEATGDYPDYIFHSESHSDRWRLNPKPYSTEKFSDYSRIRAGVFLPLDEPRELDRGEVLVSPDLKIYRKKRPFY